MNLVSLVLPETILAATLFWNLLLTAFVIVMVGKYRRLVKGNNGLNLIDIVGKLVEKENALEKKLFSLETVTGALATAAQRYLQRVGLVRFNPYNEVGGEHSFAAAFLDKDNNGLVISNLHGREGSRLYAKLIKKAEGVEHALSDEEKTAIEAAKAR